MLNSPTNAPQRSLFRPGNNTATGFIKSHQRNLTSLLNTPLDLEKPEIAKTVAPRGLGLLRDRYAAEGQKNAEHLYSLMNSIKFKKSGKGDSVFSPQKTFTTSFNLHSGLESLTMTST